MAWLIALGVIVPVVEILAFMQVAQWIGGWNALILLVVVSVCGVWLLKAQGVSVYRQGRAEIAAHRVPGRALVDGGLVATAGVLLVIPGFVTAALALLLLTPVVRGGVRNRLIRRWTRAARGLASTATSVASRSGPVVDVGSGVVVRGSDPQELGGRRAIEAGDEPFG